MSTGYRICDMIVHQMGTHEVAEKLGMSQGNVLRLFRENIHEYLTVCGKRFYFSPTAKSLEMVSGWDR